MPRKLIHLSLPIAAWFALALAPTAATASPLLTYPTGTPLATGSLLQITNIGVAFSPNLNGMSNARRLGSQGN